MKTTDGHADAVIELIDEITRLRGRIFHASRQDQGAQMSGLLWLVLSAVVLAKTPPTAARIGRSLGHPRQSVQRLAVDLQGRGLIDFHDNPDHLRAKLLLPTPVGIQLHGEQNVRSLEWAARVAGDLDQAELTQAVQTLRHLRVRVEQDSKQETVGQARKTKESTA